MFQTKAVKFQPAKIANGLLGAMALAMLIVVTVLATPGLAYAAGSVSINNRTVTPAAIGVWGNGTDADGTPGTPAATVDGNSVTVENGGFVSGTNGYIYGGSNATFSNASTPVLVQGNSVVLQGNGNMVQNAIYGGYGENASCTGSTVTVQGNSVKLSGMSTNVGTSITGGRAKCDGGTASALNNSVSISDGSVGMHIFGSYVEGTGAGAAKNNTVTISGGQVSRDVFGGYIVQAGAATNNTLNLSGTPIFTGSGSNGVIGGGRNNGTGDAFTGNTLNLNNTAGITFTVNHVYNFAKLNFTISNSLTNSTAMLTAAGNVNLTNGGTGTTAGATSSQIGINVDPARTALQVGDQFVLIDAGTLVSGNLAGTTATGRHGKLVYTYDLTVSGNQLLATVASVDSYTYSTLYEFDPFAGSGTVSASIDADVSKFEQLLDADGNLVDPANYVITSGSTVITLSEAYLQSLAIGTYTYAAVFVDGYSAPLTLQIDANLPQTGASNQGNPWLMVLALLTVAGAAMLTVRKLDSKIVR